MFAYFLPLACFLHRNTPPLFEGTNKGDDMDPKLAIFFLLIGVIIGLSHLSDETVARMRRQFAAKRWRTIVPARRKS
jgi:hypothetical protein